MTKSIEAPTEENNGSPKDQNNIWDFVRKE